MTLPQDGAFLSPAPLRGWHACWWLASRLHAAAPTGSGGWTRRRASSSPSSTTPENHELQPQALEARALPDGRSSVVDEKQPWAKLYCLNVYESDLDQRGLDSAALVKRIRILEGLPRTAGTLSPLLDKRFIGEFDIDPDGSFHAQVPANVPVQIQAIDADGMALRTSAWIWAKNKEQRGCIGCHEDGERTPENVLASALTHPAVNLMLAPERRRTVDFERDIAPVLRARCASAACHGGTAAPKLGGQQSAPYEALLAGDAQGGSPLRGRRARRGPAGWCGRCSAATRRVRGTGTRGRRTVGGCLPQGAAPLT